MKLVSMLLAVVLVAAGVFVPVDTSAAEEAASISNTGPHSKNRIKKVDRQSYRRTNRTRVVVNNSTDQEAWTGNARVKYNTEAGDATTGDASNNNSTNVTGSVDNSGSGDYNGCGCDDDGDYSIDTTGPHSKNRIVKKNRRTHRVRNHTHVNVDNDTWQGAYSGNARVVKNTEGGDATTGDASNDNDTTVDVTVDNSGAGHSGDDCGCGGGDAHIDTTGPNSTNVIKMVNGSHTSVTNSTNLNVGNSTAQAAGSGNASVVGNTMGGSASTGNASNVNASSFSFSVTN